MKVIIVHAEWGVFLGICLGLAFWSKLEDGGQTSAPVFNDEADATMFLEGFPPSVSREHFTFPKVPTVTGHASMADCLKAGVTPWVH
jgi:hypothetical protein